MIAAMRKSDGIVPEFHIGADHGDAYVRARYRLEPNRYAHEEGQRRYSYATIVIPEANPGFPDVDGDVPALRLVINSGGIDALIGYLELIRDDLAEPITQEQLDEMRADA